MIAGRTEHKGCSGGVLHTGRFVVSVRRPGRPPVDTDLNALLGAADLSFPEDGYSSVPPIHFADFNRDGHPDFSIAPHFCGNNGQYSLLTIGQDGRVSRLATVPEGPLWIFDSGTSSESIAVTQDGIQFSAYDNSSGTGVSSSYRWDPARRAFVFIPPTPRPEN